MLKVGAIQLSEIVRQLHLSVSCGDQLLGRNVTGGYAGDLMSDVLAHGKVGNVWVTMQVHENIVAIAVQAKLTAVILSQGRNPAAETLQKAREHGVALLVSDKSTFETVADLARIGIS